MRTLDDYETVGKCIVFLCKLKDRQTDGEEHMNIELSDETFSSIMVAELQELHRHCTDPMFECEDVEKFQAAVRLVLEQYMVPQEYVQWEIENT